MRRKTLGLLSLPALGLLGAAAALACGGGGTNSVCATASVPPQTIAANGTPVGTIPAASSVACQTVTYTIPTSTVTQTVTVTQTGTTATTATTATTSTVGTTTIGTTTVGTTTSTPPPNDWWAWNAQTATVDPNNAALMATFLGYAVNNPNLTLYSYGVAEVTATSNSPCYAVPVTDGGTVDPSVCIPLGTKPDPSGDGHLTILDPTNGRETDFWQARYDTATQRISGASSGASFPAGFWTEHTAPCGWAGNAACFPLRRGLITPDDVLSGVINHPLVFSTPQIGGTSTSYVYPATHNSPTCGSTCTNHLPEGTWMRLPTSVDCTAYSLPAWQVMACVALQKYGMFLRDNGGTMGVYGVDPINGGTQWSAVGLSDNSVSFSKSFPWSQLQVLEPPSP